MLADPKPLSTSVATVLPLCKSHAFLCQFLSVQGLYMDPGTLQPLMDNAGMVEAVRILQALSALTAPGSNETCQAWNTDWDEVSSL